MRKFFIAVLGMGLMVSQAQAQKVITIDFSKKEQTIENIGSSTGMHSDYIARTWSLDVVDQVAELLFDPEKGIGLSAFRIQIGAGAEGAASGIRAPFRRTDCFLRPDGSYDWNSGVGTTYWLKKAKEYGIETVIGYLNSPPVMYTANGYGFKTDKTFTSNLKPNHYGDYATFIATVAQHFQEQGTPFSHISPVNEPQWYWHGNPGRAKQEGTPWTNEQISRLARLLDAEFQKNNIRAKVLIPEAAEYPALYAPLREKYYAKATDQVRAFWDKKSPDYVGNLQSLEGAVAGHAYFVDDSVEKMLLNRRAVKKVIAKTDPSLRFWQSEYCLLGKGWTGEFPASEVDEMTAALLLARNIHIDFTVADATAWQWWSSTEPQMGNVPRYCLIEADKNGAETFRATKLLWAVGHYSRFIRPGMRRVDTVSAEPLEDRLKSVMASAYVDLNMRRLVVVMINLSDERQPLELQQENGHPLLGNADRLEGWITDSNRDLERFVPDRKQLSLPPKSMITLVVSSGK